MKPSVVSKTGCLSIVLFYLAGFPVLFVTLAMFGKLALICELCTHFFIEYFFAFLIAVVLFLLLRRWREAAFFSVFLLICVFQLLPFYIPYRSGAAIDAPLLSIVQVNVNTINKKYDAVADYVLSTKADVAAFEETSQEWIDHLKTRLDSTYPHSMYVARNDNFGIALFSKYPFVSQSIHYFGVDLPSTVAKLDVDGKQVTLIGTHTVPPLLEGHLNFRTRELEAIVAKRNEFGERYVLHGDLNCTSWSPYFTDVLKGLSLYDSRLGFGVQPSWPTYAVLLRAPIDHVLVNDAFVVLDRKLGPNVGSDHFPVYVKLAIVK